MKINSHKRAKKFIENATSFLDFVELRNRKIGKLETEDLLKLSVINNSIF